MRLLAIETSCDETAAAVFDDDKLLSNIVYSQLSLHQSFGGVVPELASRAHLQTIIPTIKEALTEAKTSKNEIDGIAVTYGPGLVGALLVGVNVAKAIAFGKKIPLVGINHLEGHIFANQLDHPHLQPPLLTLLISGGHTILILVENWGIYKILGQTIDDAAGEAFDKVAKMLTLGYPGGPIIDHFAKHGNPDFVKFPRAMMKDKNLKFSFSGLKTAVLNYIESQSKEFVRENVSNICASFQKAIVDVLISKSFRAAKDNQVDQIALAGGVARNEYFRSEFLSRAKNQFKIYFPSPDFCTDNAAMIGKTGSFYFQQGKQSDYSLDAVPNLALDSNGVK